jgi:hypothetical protein
MNYFERELMGEFIDTSIEPNSLEHRWILYHVQMEENDRRLPGCWSKYEKDSWIPNPYYKWFSLRGSSFYLEKHNLYGTTCPKWIQEMTYTRLCDVLATI